MGRKWNNIKMRKASKDASQSRVYAKFGIEIYVVAKQGGCSPEANAALRWTLERAKTMNVPRHIIDRAIQKAREGVDETYEQLRYEGFGVQGSMVLVETMTNNVNRTAAEVRSAFAKHGGNLGVPGCCAHRFTACAMIGIAWEEQEAELVWEWLMDADIEPIDVVVEDEGLIVYGTLDDFGRIQDVLRQQGIEQFLIAETTMKPAYTIDLDEEQMFQFEKMIGVLESLDDVQRVFHNAN